MGEKMKLGFFGGCFNPPSNIHINLAQDVLKHFCLDKVFFVPVGDYYSKASLVNATHRFNMLKISTQNVKNTESKTQNCIVFLTCLSIAFILNS